jgi:hypothetical protein
MIVIVEVNIVHDLKVFLPKTDQFIALVFQMREYKNKYT